MVLTTYVLPILSLSVGVISLVIFCYALLKAREFIATLSQSIQEIFEPRGEDQLSLFGEVLHQHSYDIGKEVSQGITQGITGSMGGTIKRANQEVEQALAVQNPQVAQQMAFQKMLPKGMQNNPIMSSFMGAIFQKALGLGGGNGKSADTVNTSGPDPNSGMWG